MPIKNGKKEKILLSVWIVFSLFLLSPADLFSQEPPETPLFAYDLFLSKGISHYNQKEYAQAVSNLKKALEIKPEDLYAAYYLGVSLRQSGENKEAEEALGQVARRDADFKNVHFELGVVAFNLGNDQKALRELAVAEKKEPGNPLVFYYQGLAYHRLKDYERSSPRFLRSAALAPDLGLTAHFYAGVGFYHRGNFPEAKDSFEETVKIDPTSSVAKKAREFLRELEGVSEDKKPWRVSFSTAYQYDSNVVLLPDGSPLPGGISQQADHRFVFYLNGDYRFHSSDRWGVAGFYSLYQNLHTELNSFNSRIHRIGFKGGYRTGDLILQMPYAFQYVLVDEDAFLLQHELRPSVTWKSTSRTSTDFYYSVQIQDFDNTGQFSNNDDRDGINHQVGADQFFDVQEGKVRLGYQFNRNITGDSPSEDDWDYLGHTFSGGVTSPPVFGIRLEVDASYTLQDFKNPNSFSSGGQKREDRIQSYSAALSRAFEKWLTVGVQYLFSDHDSNIQVFEFDRSIYSVMVTGSF